MIRLHTHQGTHVYFKHSFFPLTVDRLATYVRRNQSNCACHVQRRKWVGGGVGEGVESFATPLHTLLGTWVVVGTSSSIPKSVCLVLCSRFVYGVYIERKKETRKQLKTLKIKIKTQGQPTTDDPERGRQRCRYIVRFVVVYSVEPLGTCPFYLS